MEVSTGQFHKLLDGQIIPEGYVGPFERGDGILMGNVVCVHEFGLTVRVAQVGAVVEHLGQRFRVMKLENGNAVLRSMASLVGPKTHDPAAAAAADKQLTDQVMEDAEELLDGPEPVPFDALEQRIVEKQQEVERVYGGHGNEVIIEKPERDEANEELRKALGDRMAPPDAHTATVARMNAGAREVMGEGPPDEVTQADDFDEQQRQVDRKIADDLCAIEEGLSDWEVEFIESVANHLGNDPHAVLSDAQRDKANEILTEKE